jgi:hypothetical protein
MKRIVHIILLLVSVSAFAQTDRELLLKVIEQQNTTNTKIDALQKQMDVRFEAMQKQMDVRFEAMDRRFEAADKRIDILLYVMIAILTGTF